MKAVQQLKKSLCRQLLVVQSEQQQGTCVSFEGLLNRQHRFGTSWLIEGLYTQVGSYALQRLLDYIVAKVDSLQ